MRENAAFINVPPRVQGMILGIVGIILTLLFAWLLIEALRFRASATHTEGEVTRIEWTEARPNQAKLAHAVVQFRDDERVVEIRSRGGSSQPSYTVGDKVAVVYQPERAEEGRIDSFAENFLLVIFLGVAGPGLIALGAVLYMRGPRQSLAGARQALGQIDAAVLARHQRAMSEGTALQARVTQIRVDETVTVEGRHPWVIIAEYQDEGIGPKLTFTSEPIWFDPGPFYEVGSDVKVFYLPEEPSVYAVALDRLPD